MRSSFIAFSLALAVAAGASCSKGPAYGSDNAIIVVLPKALEADLREPIEAAFERTFFTTRDEAIFEVTFTTPEEIGDFRQWKRLVIIEPTDEAVLLPEIADASEAGTIDTEVEDKWARDQTIHVLGAPGREETATFAAARLDSLYEVIHGRFREHHIARMWASGPDSSLARQIEDDLGLSIVLPRVYRPAQASAPADTRTWFNVDPRRIVSIHWTDAPDSLTADVVLETRRAWGHDLFPGDSIDATIRDSVAIAVDSIPPAPEPLSITEASLGGTPAIRLQGVWRNTADVSAGVFLTYGLVCGERLVLLDGNLYAPDREKYPYVLQLEQIFTTFRCGPRD